MLSVSVWRATLGVDAKTVVEAVDYDEDTEAIVASVRPRRATRRRCGRCGAVPPAMTGVTAVAGGVLWTSARPAATSKPTRSG